MLNLCSKYCIINLDIICLQRNSTQKTNNEKQVLFISEPGKSRYGKKWVSKINPAFSRFGRISINPVYPGLAMYGLNHVCNYWLSLYEHNRKIYHGISNYTVSRLSSFRERLVQEACQDAAGNYVRQVLHARSLPRETCKKDCLNLWTQKISKHCLCWMGWMTSKNAKSTWCIFAFSGIQLINQVWKIFFKNVLSVFALHLAIVYLISVDLPYH